MEKQTCIRIILASCVHIMLVYFLCNLFNFFLHKSQLSGLGDESIERFKAFNAVP